MSIGCNNVSLNALATAGPGFYDVWRRISCWSQSKDQRGGTEVFHFHELVYKASEGQPTIGSVSRQIHFVPWKQKCKRIAQLIFIYI